MPTSTDLASLLEGRPASASRSDGFSVIGGEPDREGVVDSGGGLLQGENQSKRAFLSLMIDAAAASSSSKGAPPAPSPSNAPFAILYVSQYMIDNGLVCRGFIGSLKEDAPTTVCVKSSCEVNKHKLLKDESLVGNRFYLTKGNKAFDPEEIFCVAPGADEDLFEAAMSLSQNCNDAFQEASSYSLTLGSARIAFEDFKGKVAELRARNDVGEVGSLTGKSIEMKVENQNTSNNIQKEDVILSNILSKVTSMQTKLGSVEIEFSDLKRENQDMKIKLSSARARVEKLEAAGSVQADFSSLVKRIEKLEFSSSPDGVTPSASVIASIQEEMKRIRHEMLLQDSRSQSQTLVFGKVVLRSPADVLLFVHDHFPVATFGCHYDAPALLDACSTESITAKDYADTEHSAMKSKFLNSAEITTGASFQRVTPVPLGGAASGTQIRSHSIDALLGKMVKRSDWISLGGTEGLKPALDAELRYKERSITDSIAINHGDSLGGVLATHFLKDSYNFCTSAFTWTESFHVELCGLTQGVTSDEAWTLICHCWLAMFLDFRRVRAHCGSNSVAGLDADSPVRKERVARYIWAMGQCIQIQNEYVEKGFRGHPTISSVINYHLYKYRVPTSVHQASVTQFTKQISELNTSKGQLVRRLDKCEKSIEKLEKKN